MNKETIFALDRLRRNMLSKHTDELRRILLKYYEIGTKIIITKDYWRIEEPDDKN